MKIFFYLHPFINPQKAAYQHTIIALAEGLKELNIEFYSDINYWQTSDGFLFKKKELSFANECDIVVMNNVWFDYQKCFPTNFFQLKAKKIFIDASDGIYTRSFSKEFEKFDLILRTHLNKKIFNIPKNIYPWAFGFTNRILEALKDKVEFDKREDLLLSNFRVYHPVREDAKNKAYPVISKYLTIDTTCNNFDVPKEDKLYWELTGKRHYQSYYKLLTNSKAVACFGGYYRTKYPSNSILFKVINKITPNRLKLVHQYDSFRLWETFVAESVAFHLDFDKYNLYMPVTPKNYYDYIGIDFDNLSKLDNFLKYNKKDLKTIAQNGYNWAIKYYSPKAVAKRFLELI